MKKLILTLASLLVLNVGIGSAAPLNELHTHETAVGIMIHDNDNNLYIEHKLSPKITIGLQNGDMDDLYGQFHLTDNLRAIVGNRDFGSASDTYIGLGVTGPLSAEWNGFASFVAGSDHKELQVGANYAIAHNVDLTVSYRSFRPDGGGNDNDLGLGVAFKF